MELFMLIFFGAIACMFFVFAWLFLKKQRITLIHDYHYPHVREKDIPAYTKLYGCAMLCIGSGCLALGVINFLTKSQWGWLAFVAGFAAGIWLIAKAQMKYNR